MPRPSYSFTLAGIEPKDPRFRAATEDTRRAYWRHIASEGIDVYRASRELNLDRHGVPMHPLAASTIARGRWRSHTGHGDPHGPALDPAHGESRTESLLYGRGFADHAEWGWRVDPVTGQPWGRILHYHRIGGAHLPVRDVIGLSTEERLELARRGQVWWSAYLNGQAVRHAAEAAQLPARRIAALAERGAPPKIKLVGRTDLEHSVGSIGGFGTEATREAIASGYHTGFRQLPPLRGKPKGGAAAPKPPKPAPTVPLRPAAAIAPKVKRPAAVASSVVHGPNGLTFEAVHPESYETVVTDLQALARQLSTQPEHVGPGGTGAAKPGSYRGVEEFLVKAKAQNIPVQMPRVALDAQGAPVVIDGRHRLAVFGDQGVRFLPLSVPIEQARTFRQKFGQLGF